MGITTAHEIGRRGGIGSHHSAHAQYDTWLTPLQIISVLGVFDLDPCAAPSPRPWPTAERHIELPEDGLNAPWHGRVWLNPPYGTTIGDPARKGEITPLTSVLSRVVTSIEWAGFQPGESFRDLDYSLYPNYSTSIGFTQRGCRLACSFCCVPYKEGAMRPVQSIYDIWRGDGFPKHLHLLDNDFFGQSSWRERITEIRESGFKVSFNQGINARFLTDETAEALASVDYRSDDMVVKRIYTAWDNLKDEQRLFDGLNRLVKFGVKPDHIMVYVLIGFWPGETAADRVYRIRKLIDFGARPYPMPYVRTPELVGMQRWAIGAYAKDKTVSWEKWQAANYRPENLRRAEPTLPLFEQPA